MPQSPCFVHCGKPACVKLGCILVYNEEHRMEIDDMKIAPNKPEDTLNEDTPITSGIGYYVSDIHCTKAIGYLSGALILEGFLPEEFNSPTLLDMWHKALEMTMVPNEMSPIGPDHERAKEILNERAEAASEVRPDTAG